ISSVKFAVNIILNLLIISKVHVGSHQPPINLQAGACLSLRSSLFCLGYCLWRNTLRFQKRRVDSLNEWGTTTLPSPTALLILLRSGILTFIESATRNAFYLCLASNIVSMRSTYATAWGVFNTIRWGLIMVPVQAVTDVLITHVSYCKQQTEHTNQRYSLGRYKVFTLNKYSPA
ncbi:hypothetical protein F5883DRAFT_441843, partial [Diaporthe sp. PMI_573]